MSKTSSTKPVVSLIWAEDRNHLIGKDQALPWRLPVDMRWFRQQTMGKPVLMGRKTHDSIGMVLPGRLNLIQSRGEASVLAECVRVHSVDEAMQQVAAYDELMVIGGSEIYKLWLPLADRLYVTHIDHHFSGDAYFPTMNWKAWTRTQVERHEADGKNAYACEFCLYEKL